MDSQKLQPELSLTSVFATALILKSAAGLTAKVTVLEKLKRYLQNKSGKPSFKGDLGPRHTPAFDNLQILLK